MSASFSFVTLRTHYPGGVRGQTSDRTRDVSGVNVGMTRVRGQTWNRSAQALWLLLPPRIPMVAPNTACAVIITTVPRHPGRVGRDPQRVSILGNSRPRSPGRIRSHRYQAGVGTTDRTRPHKGPPAEPNAKWLAKHLPGHGMDEVDCAPEPPRSDLGGCSFIQPNR